MGRAPAGLGACGVVGHATEGSVTFTVWFVVVGLLLIGMALGGSVLRRLPVTTSILYLAVRVCLGPHGVGLLALDPLDAPELLHRLAEVAVIVSFLAPAGRTTEQVN
jgi:NhaP-type Na+/H+ or K+/H+ antiporter